MEIIIVPVVILLTILTLGVVIITNVVGKKSESYNIGHHTKANYVSNMEAYFGKAKLTLYSAIGDALDQKSGWIKSMDIIFDIMDNNPDLVLDYLVEMYGIDDVQQTLAFMANEGKS